MDETWKPVVGYENYYEVSDKGNVRSLCNNKGPRRAPRSLKVEQTHDGYGRVHLSKGGEKVRRKVHHLVLEAFVGPRPTGLFGCHNDDNGMNNHLSNLRWGTRKSNYDDRDKNGSTAKGARHGCALISEDTARKVKTAAQDKSRLARDIANEYGVTVNIVRNIRNNKSWAWLEA